MAILVIVLMVAYAASLPGALLFLRRLSLLSDAISHSVLLGIAIMFLFVRSLNSPWLFIGATLSGILTVLCVEAIMHTRRLSYDAAVGVVFPCFFALGILIISLYARDVHLDVDMVVLGEVAFAPFYRLMVYGYDCGPQALWIAGSIALVNTGYITLFYKELQAALFDHDFSAIAGLMPNWLLYGLMVLTSITAVGSFEIVGSVVVVALMVTPAATASLFARCLHTFLMLSAALGTVSAVTGYALARYLDASIAGSIAAMTGVIFLIGCVLAPERGLYARLSQKRTMRNALGVDLVVAYLQKCESFSASVTNISHDLNWSYDQTKAIVRAGIERGTLSRSGAFITLIR